MNFADLLSGFVNEQVFGLAIILIGIGTVFTKYFGVNRKKVPQLFVVMALPISIIYHITLNPDQHVYVSIMNGIYQALFSVVISMGFYDLGKSLWKSLKYQVRKMNPTSKKQEENM